MTLLGNYASAGVNKFHHNVDRGKSGLLFEADTNSYLESIIMEIDPEGKILKTWNMAEYHLRGHDRRWGYPGRVRLQRAR